MLRQRFLSANISREYLFRDGWLFNDVRIHQAGQLEHVDLLLAVEYCFQRGVRFNLLLVLQIMFLDVLPKFLGQFSSWQRVGANDFSQRFVRLNRFHERAVCFTFFRHNCGINTASREINHKLPGRARGNKVLLPTRENLICFG
jgi:hypothetical protein